ncbi:MAG: DUF711 family protein [Chloroflexi bacterium]|nr:DUF711 family protein [Chloroflexota bacterium]
MPRIRSITLGLRPRGSAADAVRDATGWLVAARDLFTIQGFDVQTTRVSLPPVAELAPEPVSLRRLARELDALAGVVGGPDYVALGPLRPGDGEKLERLAGELPAALAEARRVFASIETTHAGRVSYRACAAYGRIVRALAETTANGFGNLQFTASAGCGPDIPFFPVAYHLSDEPAFSVALEAADLAGAAMEGDGSLRDAEKRFAASVATLRARVDDVASRLVGETGVRYAGVDLTPAPFPEDGASAAGALERLGVGTFGAPGTLAASSLWTRALRQEAARGTGFDGLMLPVLEDSVLARRAGERSYGWHMLLLSSAVCGTGLDTVPLPGDVSEETLALFAADVATLSLVMQKPLTCRLLPVLGKGAGERTTFDFPYFANGAVLDVTPASGRLLARGLADEQP